MNRTRACTSTSLSLLALIFASASFLHAKPKIRPKPKSAADIAMDACDRKLAADWTFCAGSQDSTTRRKCDENAEARWKRCYEKAGWVFSVQGEPKLPARGPRPVKPNAGASAGVDKGKPTPNATTNPATTNRPELQKKPAPTPSPSPKKGVWLPYGARQTGSHMR